MSDQVHPIYAALEDASPTNVGDFLHTLYTQLKKFAQQAIDSPAERAAIVLAVTRYFDQYVAVRLPSPMVYPFREALVGIISATLETLAAA